MFDGPKIAPIEHPAECWSGCEDPACPYIHAPAKRFSASYFGHELGTFDSPGDAAAAIVQASKDLTAYFKAQRAHVKAEPRDGIWGS